MSGRAEEADVRGNRVRRFVPVHIPRFTPLVRVHRKEIEKRGLLIPQLLQLPFDWIKNHLGQRSNSMVYILITERLKNPMIVLEILLKSCIDLSGPRHQWLDWDIWKVRHYSRNSCLTSVASVKSATMKHAIRAKVVIVSVNPRPVGLSKSNITGR